MRRNIAVIGRKLRQAKSRIERHELREQLNKLLECVRYEVGAAKFDHVLEYLMKCTEKTLVFAYHQHIIEGLQAGLRRAGFGVVTLTGRTRDAAIAVRRFQEEPGCLFFVGNIRAAGTGITLTTASHVVFAELDWTPALHRQAEDRAHRLGQTGQVKVVYFVLDEANATDRYIFSLLEAKELISNRALNRMAAVGMTRGVPPPLT